MTMHIYLDHAAATPMDARVFAAMQPYFTDSFYNPSATYMAAQSVAKDIQEARARIAGVLGARPLEIIFTAGSTEANNLAIRGIMDQHPTGNLVVSAIEHDSVLDPAQSLAGQSRNSEEACAVKTAPVLPDGIVDVQALARLIDDDTVLVSVMYANNEIGTIQPIRRIAQLVQDVRKTRRTAGNETPLYLHTDAAQAANYLDLHVSRLGADLVTLNGGKIYGPKQSGILYVHHAVRLQPQIRGGGQERGMRSGTENVAGIVGLATALTLASAMRQSEAKRLLALQKQFVDALEAAIPEVIINGSQRNRLPNNIHITLPGTDNERLLFALDEAGILAAAGSACSASSEQPSHVLRALGISDADAQSSLRFTMGRSTTAADVAHVVESLVKIVRLP